MVTSCSNCPLRKLDAFKDISGAELTFMDRFKTGELEAQPGTEIMAQGQSSTHLFTCLRGMGLRYKTFENGHRQVIGFVMPGDFIGLQAGVMSEMEHSVEASTQMALCTFNRSDLWTLFKSHPSLAYDLTRIAALEEVFLGEALSVVGQLDAHAKVAWALQRFFTRLQAVGMGGDNHVPLPYRQQDLADALGLSLVHTNKTLARLREAQVATWVGSRLTVHDPDELAKMAHIDLATVRKRPLI
ncbi:Crp/Fnr family transcriptional regulator [Cognatishimia sp. F0-27]|uniref:Crp/Fnr family transcriptional regulator n=1 Tax=Cognatishimia sp. F0-27 TaxID=2816855 RepID=UPI001D0CAEAA|nr:Crp/Fnr family transcriptional regulator [Cognatishimia sp. F0-27]MCC1493877.1 Crp/Fnr family transcriptional regulator [Cognatishimia sp. F0-27]